MVNAPRIVIAAPASGHGKTTVATGLIAAIAAKGLRPTGFKVGPDFIDPSFHTIAGGRPGRNLDPVLTGEDLVVPMFLHGAAGAEVSIVEGAMGLYDGRTGEGDFGSTAHVASLLEAPIVMVVDATGQGRSIAAVLHGFRTFGQARIAGVVLNRVGSPRHEEILREACDEVGLPVLGALRRLDEAAVPSRHLGLVPAAERAEGARKAVKAMGEIVDGGADIEELLALARGAPPLSATAWAPPPAEEPRTRPVVALAGGPAFTFGYAEQSELLTAAGAEVASFDPLRDAKLPAGTAAVIVGGGFPEVHAAALAANAPLRREVKALALAGAPVVAECAGLLWLGATLEGHEMCGVLDLHGRMTGQLTLGYRDAVALSPSVLAEPGRRVTGHEFHRTTVSPAAGAHPAWAWRGTPAEGFVQGRVHASFLHTHWAGYPEFAQRVVAACG